MLLGVGLLIFAIIKVVIDLFKKRPKKVSAILFVVGFVSIIIGGTTLGSSSDSPKKEAQEDRQGTEKASTSVKEDSDEVKEDVQESSKELSVEDKVIESVNDELGAKTNTKKKRIHKVEVYDDVANVWINANENLTKGMMKKGIWRDTIEVVEELSDIKEIERFQIVWMLPFTDKYGKETDSKAMSADFPREVIEKIDFENVDYNNVPDISENYWEHNAIK